MEQPLDPLVVSELGRIQLFPLVRVSQELVDRLAERVLDARALELRHHQGNAVYKEHCVRDNVPTTARQLDLELVDDKEIVVLPVVEINEPHRLRPTVVPVRPALDNRAFQEQTCRRLVGLHKPILAEAFKVSNGPVNPRIIEPWLAIRSGIDSAQCRT